MQLKLKSTVPFSSPFIKTASDHERNMFRWIFVSKTQTVCAVMTIWAAYYVDMIKVTVWSSETRRDEAEWAIGLWGMLLVETNGSAAVMSYWQQSIWARSGIGPDDDGRNTQTHAVLSLLWTELSYCSPCMLYRCLETQSRGCLFSAENLNCKSVCWSKDVDLQERKTNIEMNQDLLLLFDKAFTTASDVDAKKKKKSVITLHGYVWTSAS